MDTFNNNIVTFVIDIEEKRTNIFIMLLQLLGVQFTKFPLIIEIDKLNTPENMNIINELSNNTELKKIFKCRSLYTFRENDKKRLNNIIKQIARECNIILKRQGNKRSHLITNQIQSYQVYLLTKNT